MADLKQTLAVAEASVGLGAFLGLAAIGAATLIWILCLKGRDPKQHG